MTDALGWLADAAQARRTAGLHRVLRPRPPGPDGVLDLASNDYLGLSRHSDVVAAAVAALHAYGAGATGSRLVTGDTALHGQLEDALAARLGSDEALVFSSGYLANLGAVTALSGPGTLVVSDEGNHASLIDACRLSRARVVVVAHRDLPAVERALTGRTEPRALVVTDGVFSVGGDLAPVARLHELCRAHGAALLVDEAHSLGVLGRTGEGLCASLGLTRSPDVVVTLTLSKSLGSQGGAVLGPAGLREQLADTARAFVFDTGLAPAAAGAALAALGLADAARATAVRRAAARLADELGVPRPAGAVVPVHVGDPHGAAAAQEHCLAQGVRVGCFRPPSVPQGRACLRLTARADLTDEELSRAVVTVRAALEAISRDTAASPPA